MVNKCVVTIAVGKLYYHQLAKNLLKSFLLWNSSNDINFLLLTDDVDFYEEYFAMEKVSIQKIDLDGVQASFTAKLKLPHYTIAKENLFVDCDCIIYADIQFVFDAFAGHNFSCIGNMITDGHFFGDVKAILRQFNVAAIPKLVGSIYYYKHNTVAGGIFEKAQELKTRYDELNLVRLRGHENEEPLLAIAMAIYNEHTLPNNGKIKADAMFYTSINANVLRGAAKLIGPKYDVSGIEIIPATSSPAIVHYNAGFSGLWIYLADAFRLNNQQYPVHVTDFLVLLKYKMPHHIKTAAKNSLRPLYHQLFGFRQIKNQRQ